MTRKLPAAPQVAEQDDKFVPSTFVGQLQPNYYCRAWNAKRIKYCKALAGSGTQHVGFGRCRHHGGLQEGDPRLKHGQRQRRYHILAKSHVGQLIESHLADDAPLDVREDLALARGLLEDFVDRYTQITAALIAWHDTWEGRFIPISADEKQALLDALDEYEVLLGESEQTDKAAADLELARSAVAFLSTPQNPKPRKIVDISNAIQYIDVVSKVIHRVESIRASAAISYDQLKRFMFAVERVIESRVRDADLVKRIHDDLLEIRI